jgi:TPR repeat protein
MSSGLAEAADYFRLSADQNNAFGQFYCAYCFEHGKGVARNFSEAANRYRLSADQGNHDAQFRYAVCLQTWGGGAGDELKSVKYVELLTAADRERTQRDYRDDLECGAA